VFTAGLTTSITGLHCDISVMDDVVVKENAYTNDGRDKVKQQYSLLSSIEGAEAENWVVGTRYHPKDLYNDLMSMEVDLYDEYGDENGSYPLYEVFERQVENRGDGTGEFLWPRQQRYDGKWFGFDAGILAKKRAQYLDRVQFKAQYYNNPSCVEDASIQRECFQYYEPKLLTRQEGKWYFKGYRINVFAAIDFAFSLNRKADYTAIVVVGVDAYNNYYVLEVDRFKTGKISEYFEHILKLHQKWDFRKIRAETTVAQSVIVEDLKLNYIRPHGLALSIDGHNPTRAQGSKEERVDAILQPRYENRQVWHYMGGNCQLLEDEIAITNPPHDDIKDALASCIEICVSPNANYHVQSRNSFSSRTGFPSNRISSGRFGGIF